MKLIIAWNFLISSEHLAIEDTWSNREIQLFGLDADDISSSLKTARKASGLIKDDIYTVTNSRA